MGERERDRKREREREVSDIDTLHLKYTRHIVFHLLDFDPGNLEPRQKKREFIRK